jgi:hypothetical protein
MAAKRREKHKDMMIILLLFCASCAFLWPIHYFGRGFAAPGSFAVKKDRYSSGIEASIP